eukprot:scaffold410672_cov30-Prasinocladus_malaysianus.AAC.1
MVWYIRLGLHNGSHRVSKPREHSRPSPAQRLLGAMSRNNGARPTVMISNDDGVAAAGLRALVAALHDSECCQIYVCGPAACCGCPCQRNDLLKAMQSPSK